MQRPVSRQAAGAPGPLAEDPQRGRGVAGPRFWAWHLLERGAGGANTIRATASPRTPASKPTALTRRRATTLQSSPAPTRAQCCNARPCQKKPVHKISTCSAAEPAARRPRRPRPPPKHCRSPPLQARQVLPTRKSATRRPQERDQVNKKWPKPLLNRYENGAAPPSASPRKRGPRSLEELQDHEPRVIARGIPKNAR